MPELLDLPQHLLLKIFEKLNICSLDRLSKVNSQLRLLANDNVMWQKKLRQHFMRETHYYESVKDYKELFKKAEEENYDDLSAKEITLFRIVKEADLSLQTLKNNRFSNYDAFYQEVYQNLDKLEGSDNYLYYIINNQALLDRIFKNKKRDQLNLIPDNQNRTLLYWASICRQPLQVFKELIADGCNVNIAAINNFTPIFEASVNGLEQNIIEHLILAGADLTANKKYDLLYDTCFFGHSHVVKILLDNGMKPNNLNGESYLYIAAKNGYLNVVRQLVKAKYDLNQVNVDGESALFIASQNSHYNIVEFLLSAGADPETIDINGANSLLIASEKGHYRIVKLLLTTNINIHQIDNLGYSALLNAIDVNNIDMVKLLLHYNFDINQSTTAGFSSLYIAVNNNALEIVNLLIKAGANINHANHKGSTPIMRAAKLGFLEIVKTLYFAKASINDFNKYGNSALLIAIAENNQKVVAFLLGHDANIFQINKSGQSAYGLAKESKSEFMMDLLIIHYLKMAVRIGKPALLLAINNADVEFMMYLLNRHYDVDNLFDNKLTPLIVAILSNNIPIIKDLIKVGANVNLKSKDGSFPLLYAVKNGELEIVNLLLKSGADFEILSPKGRSLYEVAQTEGHIEISNHIAWLKKSSIIKSYLHSSVKILGYIGGTIMTSLVIDNCQTLCGENTFAIKTTLLAAGLSSAIWLNKNLLFTPEIEDKTDEDLTLSP